jgi:hypothetical protein
MGAATQSRVGRQIIALAKAIVKRIDATRHDVHDPVVRALALQKGELTTARSPLLCRVESRMRMVQSSRAGAAVAGASPDRRGTRG